MKKRLSIYIIILSCSLLLIGCEKQRSSMDDITVTPTISIQESTTDGEPKDEEYVIDVQKEWDEKEYRKTFGMDLYYFDSPITSPYQYSYLCEDEDMSTEEIADALGEVMMNDFMQSYEGKAFTVTEYRNMEAEVMSEEECSDWEANYFRMTGKKLVIKKNQWLCTYSCEYKYTGVYANIGEMPEDWEWMTILTADGSGEEYVFIIQKNDPSEYILRAMPKSVKEVRVE